jgi:hypothetical protein
MEQIGVMRSGNPINFREKVKAFFKNEKENRESNFNSMKDKVSSEFLNRKIPLRTALIDCGPIMFVGSPLKSSELEEVLYTFVVFDPNVEDVRLAPDKRIKNWKNYLNDFENPKVDEFFNIDENEKLKLSEEGIRYVKNILSKYEKDVA